MKGQPNRLEPGQHQFAGRDIDRSRPLRFTLDGRVVNGFAGDTVLSALLANDVDTLGLRNGSPLALTQRSAPLIAPAALSEQRDRYLPMARTPVLDGEEFVTVGERSGGGLFGLLKPAGPSLGLRLDAPPAPPPWLDIAAESMLAADLVVIGGGVAGLSAALAAGQSGSTVVLVERRAAIGGDARLFGSVEDEETPDAMIVRLSQALSHLDNVTMLKTAEAFAIGASGVRVHQIEAGSDGLSARILTIAAARIVLATGTSERLPIFPGNRLPGVVGLAEAFELADRFGVWPGSRVAVNTGTNPAYRLAMLALDAGIALARMSDTRLHPQSRFIEFSKAYGIPLSSGLVPRRAAPNQGGGLKVQMTLEMENLVRPEPALVADRLILGGAWQPELALWVAAGGHVHWNGVQLLATGSLPGITLAGAAAGLRSLSGCAQSGAAAAATALGRNPGPVFDIEIDPLYETPDAPPPTHPAEAEGDLPAYLDAVDFAERPSPEKPRSGFFRRRPLAARAPTEALSMETLASLLTLGAVPVEEADAIARERCLPLVLLPHMPCPAPRTIALVPAYLAGRFGSAQAVWRIAADEARHFEAGNLLYPNTDAADPHLAVGVVLAPAIDEETGAIALVGEGEAGKRLVLRDLGRQVSVRLIEPVGR